MRSSTKPKRYANTSRRPELFRLPGLADDPAQVRATRQFVQQKVRDIGAAERLLARREAVVRNLVASGRRGIRQPWRANDGPVQIAGRDDLLHFTRTHRDIPEQRAAQQCSEKAQVLKQDGG